MNTNTVDIQVMYMNEQERQTGVPTVSHYKRSLLSTPVECTYQSAASNTQSPKQ